jgi:hypothetical protein
LGVISLILIPLDDFPMTFLAFFWGVRLAATFHLSVRVFKALALALADGSLVELPLVDRVKIGMVGIRMSPSNPRIGDKSYPRPVFRQTSGDILRRYQN